MHTAKLLFVTIGTLGGHMMCRKTAEHHSYSAVAVCCVAYTSYQICLLY